MPIASPRYAFNATMVSGAPPDPGVFALWEGEELIYYGRAHSIQHQLQEHLAGAKQCTLRATHYGWEISGNPRGREAELLQEYRSAHGRVPRCNTAA
ncbi:MAG TPA: hypothetical protein VFZ84_12920 [Burkholderiales bacterium]